MHPLIAALLFVSSATIDQTSQGRVTKSWEVSTRSELALVPVGAVSLENVERIARVVDEEFDLQSQFPRQLDDPFLPNKVVHLTELNTVYFQYEIGDLQIHFKLETGTILSLSTNVDHRDEKVITPEAAAARIKRLIERIGWDYELRLKTARNDETDMGVTYLEFEQVLPGLEFPLDADIVSFASLKNGQPHYLWFSYPPRIKQPASGIVSEEVARGSAAGAVFRALGWTDVVARTNPPEFSIPDYGAYPHEMTNAHFDLVRSRTACVVYQATVNRTDSWSQELGYYTRKAVVWVDAETGRALAVADVAKNQFGTPPVTVTAPKQRFTWEGKWSLVGSDERGQLVGTILGEARPGKHVLLSRGDSTLVVGFDAASGLVVLEFDGKRHLARPDEELQKALMAAKGIEAAPFGQSPEHSQARLSSPHSHVAIS
ncbi:MAG: hypothetical protein WD716_06145 [Fimbriimonadaceae bacterium]